MKTSQIYKWNGSSVYSSDFSITTKYLELAGAGIEFKVYKIGINFGRMAGVQGAPIFSTLTILYRDGQEANGEPEWKNYGTCTANMLSQQSKTFFTEMKTEGIKGMQLKITGFIPEELYINDIIIEYRPLRRKAVTSDGK
tara:strand:- start:23335 stop:23754 length:420 start_codon:yes stop_codon:yes gene_type:complete